MGILETVLEIPAEHQQNIFGQFDAFAKKIERTFHITLLARDGSVKIIGDANMVEKAKNVLEELAVLSERGSEITEQNVNYAMSLSFDDSEGSLL